MKTSSVIRKLIIKNLSEREYNYEKNIIALMMVFTVLFAGCGNATIPADEKATESIEKGSISDREETIGAVEETDEVESPKENGVLTRLDAISEADETGLDLKEYKYSFEDRTVAEEGDSVFYLADFEDANNYLCLEDSVPVFAFNGKCIGHTKAGLKINTIGKFDEWYYLMLDREYRFIKVADAKAVNVDDSENDYVAENTSKETTASALNDAAATNPTSDAAEGVPDTPVEAPEQTNDKYTPEEAIAVWSGILNENGMIYDPNIKEFASWGTGIIYLNKGLPEEIAQQDLLGYAYGDGGGHSFNRYYYEVTGSDDGAVYITAWCCP